jgi:hypothetical protein
MKLIKEQKIHKELNKEWQYSFEIKKDKVYLVEITARAKSWWQNLKNFKSFFNDDDLTVRIDDFSFTKLNNKKGLFDSEMSWNGNQLKGLLKTNLYIFYFEKGEHTIHFINQKNPFLENIRIFQTENENGFIYIPTQNNTAENGDRRPWFAVAFVGFLIGKLNINISVGKNNKDDDDAKLIIDDKIVKNNIQKSHQNWYWCGNILRGEEKEFDEDLKFEKGVHYIELHADESPILNKIEVEINRYNIGGKIPTVDNPKWTGDFNDDTEEIILARLIFGETSGEPREAKEWVAWSVINRIEAGSWWPETIHKVILQKRQYDPFKPTDKNYLKIINPLSFSGSNKISESSWRECYKIAENVVLRKTINPTKATHFHGIGITKESYEKKIVPNGKFIKKIGNTYFYWSPN